jgi:hypothetical protein
LKDGSKNKGRVRNGTAFLLPKSTSSEVNRMALSTFNADFNQISSVLAKCRQNIHGLRDSSEELIPLFLNKIVQLTV